MIPLDQLCRQSRNLIWQRHLPKPMYLGRQPFQFGVCAAASGDPHCTFNAGLVPKAVDVITAPGVLQSDELDYTLHAPVVLQGVTIP